MGILQQAGHLARRFHNQLKWISLFAVLAWAISGFMHPIMSWTAPRPKLKALPTETLSLKGLKAPESLLKAQGLSQISRLEVLRLDDRLVYLVRPVSKGVSDFPEDLVFDAKTGEVIAAGEARLAAQMAKTFSGRKDLQVQSTERITQFSTLYPQVNRVLPAWKVRFAGPQKLDYFVDVEGKRVITSSDDTRRMLLTVFQTLHSWKFLSGLEGLRVALVTVVLGLVLASAIFGTYMAFTTKGRSPERRFHRTVGYVSGPLTILWVVSGLFHLFVRAQFEAPRLPHSVPFAVVGLSLPKLDQVQGLYAIGGVAEDGRWRAKIAEKKSLWFTAKGAELSLYKDADAAADFAVTQKLFPKSEALDLELIKSFTDDYGFDKKRLPVWQVTSVSNPKAGIFVDLNEGLIAGEKRPNLAGAERWSFDQLHKWQWGKPLFGQMNRDYLLLLAVFSIILTAGFGLWVTLKLPKKKR